MTSTAQALTREIPDVTAEFLNSLASVRSLTEILRDNPGIDSRQKQRFIDIIVTETQRMAAMVEGLPQLPISA